MPTVGRATERMTFEAAESRLPETAAYARRVLARLEIIKPLPPDAVSVVDIGAAQGRFVVGCAKLGYTAVGIEPWAGAREVATQLIEASGVEAQVLPGTAEATGLPSESFDVVIAKSVIEHVNDAQAAFNELYRILRPGGIFWFCTASSRCPRQYEISGFPLFGWYPDSLKRRIMNWVKVHRPELVGHTERPAIHWFTPKKAERMLRDAGFSGPIYDRWQLRRPAEGGPRYRRALSILHRSSAARFAADVLVPGCAFAVVK